MAPKTNALVIPNETVDAPESIESVVLVGPVFTVSTDVSTKLIVCDETPPAVGRVGGVADESVAGDGLDDELDGAEPEDEGGV